MDAKFNSIQTALWGLALLLIVNYWLNLVIAQFSIAPLNVASEPLFFVSIVLAPWVGYRLMRSPISQPARDPVGQATNMTQQAGGRSSREIIIVITINTLLFILLTLAWGLGFAGDGSGFLISYVQLDETNPTYYFLQVYWPPGTGLFYGTLLEIGGSRAVIFGQWFQATTASLAVFWVLRPWGRIISGFLLVLWWLYFPLQEGFHQIGGDPMTIWLVILWLCALRLAFTQQRFAVWFMVGILMGINTLMRAGNLAMVAAIGPVFLATPRKFVNALLILGGVAVFVLPYIAYNGVRYDEYALARGGNALWFSAAYRTPYELIQPENGEATRHLLTIIEENILVTDVYQDIRLEDFLTQPSTRLAADTIAVVDRVEGWDTNYALLRDVGLEAIQRHPEKFVSYRVNIFARLLLTRAPLHNSTYDTNREAPEVVGTVYADFLASNPEGVIRSQEELKAVNDEVVALTHDVDEINGNVQLAGMLEFVWLRFGPSPVLLFFFTLVSFAYYRGQTLWFLAALLIAMLAVVAPASIVFQIRYRLPFDSILLVGAVMGYFASLAMLQARLQHRLTAR